MNKALAFCIICLGFFYLPSFAQIEVKFDTAFTNTSSLKYFQTNPSIKKIVFYTNEAQYRSLSIYPKTIWQAKENENYTNWKNYESYNLDFEGDVYVLEKKFGAFQFPEKEIAILIKKICNTQCDIRGIVTPDSINLQLSYTCVTIPVDVDPEVKIFEKVEIIRDYIGGTKKLKSNLEQALNAKKISLTNNIQDSVLIFSAVLSGKDSSMERVELIEGNYSPFSQAMMDILTIPKSWTPSLQGGRAVRSYLKIFIRLQKDNTIILDY